MRAEAPLSAALHEAGAANGTSLLLDATGEPLGAFVQQLTAPVRIALGPEGGLEPAEREAFLAHGWRTVSLGVNVLRFETAAIAALAILRAHLR